MDKILGKYSDQAYALLRIVSGLLFSMHGMQKIFGWLGGMGGSGEAAQLVSKMGLAGGIELVGGLLIMVGAFTGWAAFLSSGLMASAYFMAHFPNAFWPIENRGELAAIYAFLFLFIASRGSGIWSVDKIFKKS